jgi:hypothetical protein
MVWPVRETTVGTDDRRVTEQWSDVMVMVATFAPDLAGREAAVSFLRIFFSIIFLLSIFCCAEQRSDFLSDE